MARAREEEEAARTWGRALLCREKGSSIPRLGHGRERSLQPRGRSSLSPPRGEIVLDNVVISACGQYISGGEARSRDSASREASAIMLRPVRCPWRWRSQGGLGAQPGGGELGAGRGPALAARPWCWCSAHLLGLADVALVVTILLIFTESRSTPR